jgi:hypothetical protein
MDLKGLRLQAGLTQSELSKKLSESGRGKGYQGPVQKLESGKHSPTIAKLVDVLDVLGYSMKIVVSHKETNEVLEMNLQSLLGTTPAQENTREVDNA